MHCYRRTHLWWLLFAFPFTLLQLLLCYPHCLSLIIYITNFYIHLFICLGKLLPCFTFIYSSKFLTACPRILTCRHRANIGIHSYFKTWIRSSYSYTSFLCFGDNFIIFYYLISVKYNLENAIFCLTYRELHTFINHASCLGFDNFNNKFFSSSFGNATPMFPKSPAPLNISILFKIGMAPYLSIR